MANLVIQHDSAVIHHIHFILLQLLPTRHTQDGGDATTKPAPNVFTPNDLVNGGSELGGIKGTFDDVQTLGGRCGRFCLKCPITVHHRHDTNLAIFILHSDV